MRIMRSCASSVVLAVLFVALAHPAASAKVVHVVFSNHLDIGFHAWGSLGFDNKVINTYIQLHFPRAVRADVPALLPQTQF